MSAKVFFFFSEFAKIGKELATEYVMNGDCIKKNELQKNYIDILYVERECFFTFA